MRYNNISIEVLVIPVPERCIFLQSDTTTKGQGRMARTSQSNGCYLGVGTMEKETDDLSVSALALFGLCFCSCQVSWYQW